MKNLKKVITAALAMGISLCCFIAKADTFEFTEDLFNEIEYSVRNSAFVRSKSVGIARERAVFEICKKRIEFLEHTIESPVSSDIKLNILRYVQSCGILSKRYEDTQLRRSKTEAEFKHNAGVMIAAYTRLKNDVIKFAPKEFSLTSDSKVAKDDTDTSRKKRAMTTREGRKGEFHGGGRCKRK